MRRKDDIVGNKTGCYNKEGKGKTREQEKRSIEIRQKKQKRKSPNFFWVGGREPLDNIQSTWAIPMLTGRKTVKKRRFGQSCGFFP